MKLKYLAIAALTVHLGACATIVSGENQDIAFTSGSVEGADCTMTGGKDGEVSKTFRTPAEVQVPRSSKLLNVSCNKAGVGSASEAVDGTFNGWVIGNVVSWGFIGLGVDFLTGSTNKYPSDVDIPLTAADREPPAIN